jgi:3-isopropylmalate/(R)-2-methylmalate dehydratase small subunit
MTALKEYSGTALAVRGSDIDTDRIIPARFMRCVTFDGLGKYAFYDMRFDAQGQTKPHPFNDPAFAGSSILIAGKNFGCGSSREHAPQALAKWGIGALIAVSFAEIFAGNCTMMGIPAVRVSESDAQELMDLVEKNPGTRLDVDLESRMIRCGSRSWPLDMPESYRKALIDGSWDSTGILFANKQKILELSSRLPY